MVWVVISLIELCIIAIFVSVIGIQEKKYEDIVSDREHCISCEKANTNAEHDKYLEMAEKNWYLGQRNKSLITILTIAKEQPEILHMEYMNEFLKDEDEEK